MKHPDADLPLVDQLDPIDLENKIRECKILNLGCGNSNMVEEMYDRDNFRDIHNVDIVPAVIAQMVERNVERREELSWHVMDARELAYPDEIFDAVIDKSTLDSILCGDNAYRSAA